jgi:NADH-quinone oxidoreductase subunit N
MNPTPADPLVTLLQLLPEAVLAAGIMAVLLVDMLLPRGRKAAAAWVGVAACATAAVAAWTEPSGEVAGMLVVDGLALFTRSLILAVTAAVLVVLSGNQAGDAEAEDRGAFSVCTLGIALGASIAALAAHLLPLWLGLEMVSLASYALAAWKGGDRRAAEAGMKFVLFGGLASALMLFGMSHVYGLTGHLDFVGIGAALQNVPPVALAALGLVGVGLAYKLTVVPFHFYAPDVYEGAPALSVAAVGILPKIAATLALARALQLTIPASLAKPDAVATALALVAMASFVVAAFTALVQRDAKRIVAFSSIGHAGTALLALACLPAAGALPAALFQLLAYALGNLGALVCLSVLERDRGSSRLEALTGAARERPWLGALLCLFLFSLAGLPPLAGFLGKWAVLREALSFGLLDTGRALVPFAGLLLLVTTAVSAWSYLLIVRAVVLSPNESSESSEATAKEAAAPRLARVPLSTWLVLAAFGLLVVIVGLWLDGIADLASGAVLGCD